MNNYELLYILPASLTSEEIVKNFQDVKENLEKLDAKMLTTLLEHPFLTKTGISKDEESDEIKAIPVVKRKLAYPIKHEKFAFYCLVNFETEGKNIKEIDRYLKLNNTVLRHMITSADPMTEEELKNLHELFARKKAEQDKEEADLEKEEREEEKNAKKEKEERIKKIAERKEEEKKEEEVKEEKTEEKEVEEKEEITEKEEKETKEEPKETKKKKETAKKTEEVKEEKKKDTKEEKGSKKDKIKLEELEDKLDEILEDTIV